MKNDSINLSDLFHTIDVLGLNLKASVLKKDSASQLFTKYHQTIKLTSDLELSVLDDDINEYAENAVNNADLISHLEDNYKEINKFYTSISTIIPIAFHSDFKKSDDFSQTTFYDFVISELSHKILLDKKIPKIEEWDLLSEWESLEILHDKRKHLRIAIRLYTENPIHKELIDNPYPKVLINSSALPVLRELFEELNAFDRNGTVGRGFLAKANAIYQQEKNSEVNSKSKKLFRTNVRLKDYIELLNLEFNASIIYNENFKLSDGGYHKAIVEGFYRKL